jgi:hypothetical protein
MPFSRLANEHNRDILRRIVASHRGTPARNLTDHDVNNVARELVRDTEAVNLNTQDGVIVSALALAILRELAA